MSGSNGKINEVERSIKNYFLFKEKQNKVVWKNDSISDKIWGLVSFFSNKKTEKIEIDCTRNILYHLEFQGEVDNYLKRNGFIEIYSLGDL